MLECHCWNRLLNFRAQFLRSSHLNVVVFSMNRLIKLIPWQWMPMVWGTPPPTHRKSHCRYGHGFTMRLSTIGFVFDQKPSGLHPTSWMLDSRWSRAKVSVVQMFGRSSSDSWMGCRSWSLRNGKKRFQNDSNEAGAICLVTLLFLWLNKFKRDFGSSQL
jgi:hypothetical protein